MKRISVKSSVLRGVAAAGIVVAGIVVAMPGASAGGWAVSTMDAIPEPTAGESTVVGFTIRQHGVRPTNPDGEVGVTISSAGGTDTYFDATPQGARGHYTATVRFPEPGSYRWEIRQGWFAPQDLGVIRVASAAAAAVAATGGTRDAPGTPGTPGSGSEYRWPLAARLLLPAAGVTLAAFGIAEMVRARRRSRGLIAT